MNKLVLLVSLFLSAFSVQGQDSSRVANPVPFPKGTWVAGVNVRSAWLGIHGLRTNYAPRLHYFVADNWSVGPELRLDWRDRSDEFTGGGCQPAIISGSETRFPSSGRPGCRWDGGGMP